MGACQYLRRQLQGVDGVEIAFDGPHFKEFVIRLSGDIDKYLEFMANHKILAGIPLKRFHMGLDDCLLVAVTETRTQPELDGYVAAARAFLGGSR